MGEVKNLVNDIIYNSKIYIDEKKISEIIEFLSRVRKNCFKLHRNFRMMMYYGTDFRDNLTGFIRPLEFNDGKWNFLEN